MIRTFIIALLGLVAVMAILAGTIAGMILASVGAQHLGAPLWGQAVAGMMVLAVVGAAMITAAVRWFER